MKRALLTTLLAAAAGAGLFASSAATADSYCFRTGITIGGEPWLAHEECVPCPTEDCLLLPNISTIPGTDVALPIEIFRRP